MTKEYNKKQRVLLHIYNRGNRKQEICRELKDYIFLNNLIKYHFNNYFDLLCFSIMPNHYHLLAIQQGPIHVSTLMQKIGSRYTKYFNIKYGLSGHLFQGVYRCKIVNSYDQLQVVSKYIIKNPEEIHLPNTYPYLFYNDDLIQHYLLSFFREDDDLTL
jgi:putative transposase